MLRISSSLCLAAVVAGSFLGCKKDCTEPQPTCYSGKVVGTTCMMGILVDVDPAYPIGAPATAIQGNRFLGNNVIAVANSGNLGSLGRVGQQLHFTYTTAPPSTLAICCLVADGTTTTIPSFALSNVSTLSCDSTHAN
ncbi:hypothetical protein [Hymenobacter rubidus]|uniref:hypothetical protein n=1 Tax=Hymenobacter rubidus TaxID=1441626 RepID=UPI00191E81A4|nr:hypothetical protein [Hymenobacter rubidus]